MVISIFSSTILEKDIDKLDDSIGVIVRELNPTNILLSSFVFYDMYIIEWCVKNNINIDVIYFKPLPDLQEKLENSSLIDFEYSSLDEYYLHRFEYFRENSDLIIFLSNSLFKNSHKLFNDLYDLYDGNKIEVIV